MKKLIFQLYLLTYRLFMWAIFPFLLLFILFHSIFSRRLFSPYLFKLTWILPKTISKGSTLWIHGVSAGEIASTTLLVKLLDPHYNIFLTTTTYSGYEMGRKLFPNHNINYYPFDYPLFCKRILSHVKPVGVIFIEGEIWPNFLLECKKRDIKTFLVSARMGEKEFRGYTYFYPLFREVFQWYQLISCQSEGDYNHYKSFLPRSNRLQIGGSLKLDNLIIPKIKRDNPKDYRLIMGCSTHPIENRLFIKVYKELLNEYPDLKMILAPRHPKKLSHTIRMIHKHGITYTKWSSLLALSQIHHVQLLLVDTIGDLFMLYPLSDIVLLGGSFDKKVGGHNPIEALTCYNAVIAGPHTKNSEWLISSLKKKGGIIQILESKNQWVKTLYYQISDLLIHPNKRESLSQNAINYLLSHHGITKNIANQIISHLKN